MKQIAYIITAASMCGTAANSFGKRWCFVIWSVTNSFWLVYDAAYGHYAQALLYVFNLVMCVIGWRKWRRQHDR